MKHAQALIIGPELRNPADIHTGDMECDACGGGECGVHPKGCIYGGFSYGYWMYAEDCELRHD